MDGLGVRYDYTESKCFVILEAKGWEEVPSAFIDELEKYADHDEIEIVLARPQRPD